MNSLNELPPRTRRVARKLVARSVRGLDHDIRDDVAAELEADLLERLHPGSTPSQVRRVVSGWGLDPTPGMKLSGHVWGIPYSLVPPTPSRLARRVWDPTNPRIVVPRLFGAGWTLNLGAVAVRAGCIEPDAETTPFTSTPEHAFVRTAAFVALIASIAPARYLAVQRSLPERLATQWSLDSKPQRFAPTRRVVAGDLGVVLASVGLAGWAGATRVSGAARAGALTAAAGAASIAAWAAHTRLSSPRPSWWRTPLEILSVVGVVSLVLGGLARAGRAAEIRQDLSRPGL